MPTTAISTRFDPDTLARIDEIAKGTGKSRSALIKEAVANYLDYDFWYREQVEKGLEDAAKGRVFSHESVKESVRGLGYDVD